MPPVVRDLFELDFKSIARYRLQENPTIEGDNEVRITFAAARGYFKRQLRRAYPELDNSSPEAEGDEPKVFLPGNSVAQ
jgi:hypothetical protein